MKIALIAKAAWADPQAYTVDKQRVIVKPENLFLSLADRAVLTFAQQVVHTRGGTIDAYTFEPDAAAADRILHEALALGATTATKIVGGDLADPLQQRELIQRFVQRLIKQGQHYDLWLTGDTADSGFAAILAQELAAYYYEHVTALDSAFNFEIGLAKGKLLGQCQLPAVITTDDLIQVPELATFAALKTAMVAPITTIDLPIKSKPSTLVATQEQTDKVIFNLAQEPDATAKLVAKLKQDGILR